MTEGPAERLSTIEATCRLCWHLANGEAMTTAQAAQLTGYSRQGALRMLNLMSRYLPLIQDEGLWQLMSEDVGH
jgi:hypothetical protein